MVSLHNGQGKAVTHNNPVLLPLSQDQEAMKGPKRKMAACEGTLPACSLFKGR